MSVSVPGLLDTTFRGDSLYWRIISGRDQVGAEIRQLNIRMVVLDPPAPLLEPLIFEIVWRDVDPPLPATRTYTLRGDGSDGLYVQAIANLGTWFDRQGQVVLSQVTDTSISGTTTATLEPAYPPGSSLPDVDIEASFWAPHVADGSVGN